MAGAAGGLEQLLDNMRLKDGDFSNKNKFSCHNVRLVRGSGQNVRRPIEGIEVRECSAENGELLEEMGKRVSKAVQSLYRQVRSRLA